MTTNDFDRTARLWLEDGPTELSDRALQAALDEIHVTRQRRAWWPARRFSSMNNAIRLAAGAAALVLVAVVGINLVPGGGPGGPPPTPTPTASPTPTATLTPAPSPRALAVTETVVPLQPGTYVAADQFQVGLTVTVPTGWEGAIGGPYAVFLQRAQSPVAVTFSIFTDVYADPCHYKGLLKPLPGPSVDALATALAKIPGLHATTPTDVSLAGYQGKQITLTAPASFAGCTLSADGAFRIWELPLGATNDMTQSEVDRVWILAVGSQRLVIDTPETPGETAAEKAEVQGIVDSLVLAPRN